MLDSPFRTDSPLPVGAYELTFLPNLTNLSSRKFQGAPDLRYNRRSGIIDHTNQPSKKPITYFSAIKVTFRLYGIYLLITGMLDIILWLPGALMLSDYTLPHLAAKSGEALEGIAQALVGAGLLIYAPRFARRMAEPVLEITPSEDQWVIMVEIFLKFILSLIMFHLLVKGTMALLLLLMLGFMKTFDAGITIQSIIPVLFLIICFALYKKASKLAEWITK